MSEQIWAAIIGAVCVLVVHGFALVAAWVAIQVRVRALEIRVQQGEKDRESDRQAIKDLVKELHHLAVQLARQNRQNSGSNE